MNQGICQRNYRQNSRN